MRDRGIAIRLLEDNPLNVFKSQAAGMLRHDVIVPAGKGFLRLSAARLGWACDMGIERPASTSAPARLVAQKAVSSLLRRIPNSKNK